MSRIQDIFIPDLGADKDVDLIDIMVSVGDTVEVEDGLITLETDKASMDVPTTHAGVVKEILVKVGDKVNSGDLIARIEVEDEAAAQTPAPSVAKEPVAAVAVEKAPEPKATVSTEAMSLEDAKAQLEAISAANAQVSCQFVNEQTICSVVEEVYVPDLGSDTDVDLIDIMVAVGDTVEFDDGLITLETEKASMDVPAPFAGEILELCVEVGAKVNSGDLIAKVIRTVVMENKLPTPAPEVAVETKKEEHTPITVQAAVATVTGESTNVLSTKATKVYASPSVRKLAREFGVDLGFVKGTGRKNRILKEDVKAYVKEQLNKPAAAAGGAGLGFNLPEPKVIDFAQFGEIETVELSRIQKISGPSLHRNWLAMPHVTQFDEADITEMESFRKEQNALATDFKLSPLVFVVKAVAKALALHPKFNASLSADGQSLIMKKYFHIAIAVDTPNGLVVPVIRDVNKKGFKQIAIEMAEISQKAREGKLKATDMQGASFTISSLGGIGGTYFTPIINAPEVAILGLSKSEMKPKWNGETFEPRLTLPLSLSYDHKVIDGADGARFTNTLSKLLSDIRLLSL
ncbi:MAG: dihydrolipoyllysine-residue acetyltransferase [Candidatus Marinarcus sp.]|uniref:dihydrolipoyllysine-residue acetyltransferase n=1 Tax=Candidatus Marinarcus sp. TaxID=3100987 RepID=UPI003B00C63E